MNHYAPTPHSAWPHHALRGLVCLLLLGAGRLGASPRLVPGITSAPYLRVIGSLALRLQPVPVPAEPAARPAAGGPPLSATPETPAVPNPAEPRPDFIPATPHPAPETAVEKPAPVTAPPPILKDELRPRVQAEDFLPYFQFPGSAGAPGSMTVVAPVSPTSNPPHHATPSTATYRQQ